VVNDLFGLLGKAGKGIEESPVAAASLGKLLDLLKSEVISGRIAKEVFAIMFETGADPEAVIEERGLRQVTDTAAIEALVDELIAANPGQVASAAKNPKVAGWFTGQVMNATGGKANPGVVNRIVAEKLAPG
jgi:aspartyl-tRNA(Asn)/glutamyl-tRNA(Gln) amidotransferase subunit B